MGATRHKAERSFTQLARHYWSFTTNWTLLCIFRAMIFFVSSEKTAALSCNGKANCNGKMRCWLNWDEYGKFEAERKEAAKVGVKKVQESIVESMKILFSAGHFRFENIT